VSPRRLQLLPPWWISLWPYLMVCYSVLPIQGLDSVKLKSFKPASPVISDFASPPPFLVYEELYLGQLIVERGIHWLLPTVQREEYRWSLTRHVLMLHGDIPRVGQIFRKNLWVIFLTVLVFLTRQGHITNGSNSNGIHWLGTTTWCRLSQMQSSSSWAVAISIPQYSRKRPLNKYVFCCPLPFLVAARQASEKISAWHRVFLIDQHTQSLRFITAGSGCQSKSSMSLELMGLLSAAGGWLCPPLWRLGRCHTLHPSWLQWDLYCSQQYNLKSLKESSSPHIGVDCPDLSFSTGAVQLYVQSWGDRKLLDEVDALRNQFMEEVFAVWGS